MFENAFKTESLIDNTRCLRVLVFLSQKGDFFFFSLFVNFHICQQLTAGSIEQSFILFDNETSYKIGMEFYDQVQGNWEQLHRQQHLIAHGPEVFCSAPGEQGSLCIGIEQTGLELFRRGKKINTVIYNCRQSYTCLRSFST